MADIDDASARILARLRQEFIETARDQIEDIEVALDRVENGDGDADEDLLGIQREIHNIKGQGPTFGFPLTGRVAHMLEDYLINADGLKAANLSDIRVYLGLMVNLISTDEALGDDDPQDLLNSLPTGQVVTYSHQKPYNVSVLLVMPSGLQRKMVAYELLSCGFRVMRAYDSVEAISISLINSSERVFWASASIKSGRLFAATGRRCGGFWLWLAVSLVGHGSGGLRDGRRRFPGILGEAFQVLGGGGEQELVVGAGEAPEPEAPEAHVAF